MSIYDTEEGCISMDRDDSLGRHDNRVVELAPLSKVSIEDLRLMIDRQHNLERVLPRAFDILEKNPIAQGGLHLGDLLTSVLSVPESFWEDHPELSRRLVDIREELEALRVSIIEDWLPSLSRFDY
ncbi:contact-dependent growth inhibition system immunity protein [Pleionea sediminis]|uniref:contact-dependent growth inhibition system immunity protein n=1 Tax=Pleionea sediminis TaxID=2569479 RepID=UPI0011853B2B|nr:contact-dependent growth inhibition system immunity protein [Pleionea sediminis]